MTMTRRIFEVGPTEGGAFALIAMDQKHMDELLDTDGTVGWASAKDTKRALDWPSSSTRTGKVAPACSTNGRARSAPLCSSAMATTWPVSSISSDANRCHPGSWSRHPHHEPQKKSSRRLPHRSARLTVSPSSDGSVSSGSRRSRHHQHVIS